MSSRPGITRERWDILLAAYRDRPGEHTVVAREAGVTVPLARRAWERGWAQYEWAQPIKVVLLDEARAARKRRAEQRLAEEQKRAEEQARILAEGERAVTQEGQLVGVVRANAIGAASLVNRVIQAAIPLAQRLEADLAKDYAAGKVTAQQIVNLVANLAKITRLSTDSARMTIELARVQAGKPIHVTDTGGMSEEQVAEELEALERTLRRARAAGMIESELLDKETDEDLLSTPRETTH